MLRERSELPAEYADAEYEAIVQQWKAECIEAEGNDEKVDLFLQTLDPSRKSELDPTSRSVPAQNRNKLIGWIAYAAMLLLMCGLAYKAVDYRNKRNQLIQVTMNQKTLFDDFARDTLECVEQINPAKTDRILDNAHTKGIGINWGIAIALERISFALRNGKTKDCLLYTSDAADE